jgi:hypothetical protein
MRGRRCRDTCQRAVNYGQAREQTDVRLPAGALSELHTPEARSKIVSGSRSISQVEILSVRVIHTLAQKLGAGVSFSLQGKPEVAV